jgi:hypothetical protein
MPLFSIIIPVYNHERYVGLALDSLLAQTDPDWEAIVVNDGSTDSTPQVIESYAQRDARIRIVHKPNGGQPTALNTGIRLARGTWICWLSSDDLFEPGKLAIHRDHCSRFPDTRFFYTGSRLLVDSTGAVSDHDDASLVPDDNRMQLLTLLTYNFVNGISICVHRDVFDGIGLFNESYRYAQDYDFHLRALRRFPATYIPDRTCITRTHAAQYSVTQHHAMFFECARVAIEFVNLSTLQEMVPAGALDDPASAMEVVDRSLDVGLTQDALLYRLGPHPALVARVLEWLTALPPGRQKRALLGHVTDRVRMGYTFHRTSGWDVLCRSVQIAAEGVPGKIIYKPVSPADVASVQYQRIVGKSPVEAEALRQYVERYFTRVMPPLNEPVKTGEAGYGAEVLLLGCQAEEDTGDLRLLGSRFVEKGCRVLRLVIGGQGYSLDAGGYVLGVTDGFFLSMAVCSLPPADCVVATRRFKATRWTLGHGPVPLWKPITGIKGVSDTKPSSSFLMSWIRAGLSLACKVRRTSGRAFRGGGAS